MPKRIFWLTWGLVLLLAACGGGQKNALPTRYVIPTATLSTDGSGDDAAVVDLLDFWEVGSSTIAANSSQRWRFVGQAGDQVIVRLRGITGTLTVQDDAGNTLASGPSLEFALSQTAGYTIIVQSDVSGGAYEIGLGYADRPNPSELAPTVLPEVVGVPTPQPACDDLGIYSGHLIPGETAADTLSGENISHLYTFDGSAGVFIEVESRRVTGAFDPQITVYDPNCIPIAIDSGSGGEGLARVRNIYLDQEGLYSIQVRGMFGGTTEGGYSVHLARSGVYVPITPTPADIPTPTATPTIPAITPLPAPSGTRLEPNTPVLGTMERAGGLMIYTFEAIAGQTITVGATPFENAEVRLRIEISDPDGNIIGRGDATTTNADGMTLVPAFIAPIDGVYQIFATTETDAAGPYYIGFGLGNAWREVFQDAPPFDTQIDGEIAALGTRDSWVVDLRAGDIITAAVNPVTGLGFDPLLEIVLAQAPTTILVSDDNGGGDRSAFIRSFAVPETGRYLLRVSAVNAISTGTYNLIWRYINVAPTPTVPPAIYPLITLLDQVDDQRYQFYPFYGRAGQKVRIQVLSQDIENFDPVAALIAPDGMTYAEADDTDGSPNPVMIVTLPEDGTYNVRVNGYNQGGVFQLLVEALY